MKRFIFILAAFCMFMPAVTAQVRIAVISDIHVMAPELLEKEGEAYAFYIAHDRKLLSESVSLAEAAVSDVLAQDPDVVLVAGDLTKDGELLSHRLVAENVLRPFRDRNIPVFVIPGNHDVNNPHAVVFNGDEKVRTATVSAGEFAGIYADYGYASAIARDSVSLSYVAEINDSTRLLAIDACLYEENDFQEDICRTGGRIKEGTLDFIRKQALLAEKEGCRMITLVHHGIVRHWKWQDLAMGDYLVEDWKKISSRFGEWGLNLVFTGHFHAQDIATEGKGKNRVYDVETGSTVSWPLPYRIADLCGDTVKVATRHICVSEELESKARRYAMDGIRTIVSEMVPSDIPSDIVDRAAALVGEAYIAHISGDEAMTEEYEKELGHVVRRLRPYSFKYAYILKRIGTFMYTDPSVPDNEAVFVLPSARN